MQSATAKTETWEDRQAREATERKARLEAFNEKMKTVAALLGAYTSEPWSWKEPEEKAFWNPCGDLVGPDDKTIHATMDGHRNQGRISLSGSYPRDKAGRYYGGMQNQRAAITVAADKCEGKIAREIKSRLLPTYLAELAKIQERIKQSEDYDNLLYQTHNATAAAVGLEPLTEEAWRKKHGQRSEATKIWTPWDLKLAGGMLSSIVTGAGWVDVELRLPLDKALELLAQAKPARKEA